MDLSYAMGLCVVLVVIVLTHLPMPYNSLSTDDYLIRANVVGDGELFDKGMVLADPEKGALAGIFDAFHFYSPDAETAEAYTNYGNLPWWASEKPKMNPWRPIAGFTHWLDFKVAPSSYQFQLLHSLLYLMLFGFAAYRLFWLLSPHASVAVLATLFVVVDYSHFINFTWIAARNVFIAGALGCFTLEQFIRWRQQKNPLVLGFSLLLFVATLLSAEGGIALAGYLFAYLVFVERATIRSLVAALWPFAAIVIAWRLLYSYLGYGASGISLYVDPMRSPGDFLAALAATMPALFASAITSFDGYVPSLAPGWSTGAVLFSLVVALIGVRLIVPLLRSNAMVRFMFLGSVLAAVPASALISGSSRSGVFISVGFFWILALWLHQLMTVTRRRSVRFFAQGVIGVHLVLPATVAFAVSSMLLPVTYSSDMQYESVSRELHQSMGKRSLVVVNSRAPVREFYLPFTWQFDYGVMPKSINSLAPGMASFYLTRNSALEFELNAPAGLPLTDDVRISGLEGNAPPVSEVYYLQMLQGLFADSGVRYQVGDVRVAGDMQITVLESDQQGAPVRVSIKFHSSADPDEMIWQWYDWESRQYRSMTNLTLGETRFYPGPLDVKKKNMVDVCWNCDPAEAASEAK